MRILIYGAGVIGSLYAVLLSEAGFEVTVYARGRRLQTLREMGLLYRNGNEVRKAKIKIIDKLEREARYHFIFLTVREDQVKEALKELRCNQSPNIVTMVNTIEAYSEWEKLCGSGRILPAFPGAGGGIHDGVLEAGLTPWIVQPTTFGEISGQRTKRVKALAEIFRRSHIPFQIVKNMHYWQLSHLGMVVPIADAYEKSREPENVWMDREIMLDTAKEIKRNFAYFAKRKMLSPAKFHLIRHCPAGCMALILRFVFHSEFGDRFMYQHAMKAPEEMRRLHKDIYSYMGMNAKNIMQNERKFRKIKKRC